MLNGGHGNDVLTGGEGADTFVFGGIPGVDVITDFEQGADQIDFYAVISPAFSDGLFSKVANGGQSYNIAQGEARDFNDFIIQDGNDVYYDADGSESGEAVKSLTLQDDITLTASDFL